MSRRAGFTLVELVAVVLILGILAAVAVGKYRDMTEEGRKSALRSSLDTIITQIEIQTARNGGRIPSKIESDWFRDRKLPEHSYNMWGVPEVEHVDLTKIEHPTTKQITSGSAGGFWYNASNGIVRARVPNQRSAAATLKLYNEVNSSSVADLSDTRDALRKLMP